MRHHDQAALQAAVDRAIAERKGLSIPAGRYRLSRACPITFGTLTCWASSSDKRRASTWSAAPPAR